MEKRNTGGGIVDALRMLETFASVGVQFFDITHTNIDGEKRGFRPKQSLDQTRTSMPHLLASAPRRQNNVIVRPHRPPAVLLIQLDDLAEGNLTNVAPLAFLILETSPGNHQAWLAVESPQKAQDADLARRVRKAAGTDPTASGATRVAGTANFKRKYEPDFPMVAIQAAQPGRITTRAELEDRGLVAIPEPMKPLSANAPRRTRGTWPSYQYCLDRAPKTHAGDRPDISRADFAWCLTAIDWGWSVEAVANRLMEESSKAQENGERYAMTTATNAAAAVQRRRDAEHSP